MKSIIIGAGGLGREIAAALSGFFVSEYHLTGFIDDALPVGHEINGLPVPGSLEWLGNLQEPTAVFFGIGDPMTRKDVFDRISSFNPGARSNIRFPNLIHPMARIHQPEYVEMGRGNIIADSCILTTNIRIGDFNLINLACTLGHDVELGSFNSIMPGVNISGGAKIQSRVYIGTGAKLINATTIGDQSTIGAGAVVLHDIPEGETWAGVPAVRIKN